MTDKDNLKKLQAKASRISKQLTEIRSEMRELKAKIAMDTASNMVAAASGDVQLEPKLQDKIDSVDRQFDRALLVFQNPTKSIAQLAREVGISTHVMNMSFRKVVRESNKFAHNQGIDLKGFNIYMAKRKDFVAHADLWAGLIDQHRSFSKKEILKRYSQKMLADALYLRFINRAKALYIGVDEAGSRRWFKDLVYKPDGWRAEYIDDLENLDLDAAVEQVFTRRGYRKR